MSLFQVLNNEAIDEDQRANREVVARLKRSVKDNIENVKPLMQLNSVQKNILKKNFSIFERQLYRLIGNYEQKAATRKNLDVSEITDNISNIVVAYNNLVLYIDSLNYNKLSNADKNLIDKQFSNFIPVIQAIIVKLEDSIDDTLLEPLSQMENNIRIKLYNPIGFNVGEIINTEEDRRQRELDKRLLRYKSVYAINKLTSESAIKLLKELTGEETTTGTEAKRTLVDLWQDATDRKETAERIKREKEEEELRIALMKEAKLRMPEVEPAMVEQPPAMEEQPPAMEEQPPAMEEQQQAMEENPYFF